jgi:hypothetical protein
MDDGGQETPAPAALKAPAAPAAPAVPTTCLKLLVYEALSS